MFSISLHVPLPSSVALAAVVGLGCHSYRRIPSTAGPRFRLSRSINMTHASLTHVVALVGFATALTPYSVAMLRRCGLSILQYQGVEGACRMLKTLAVDAIVLQGKYAQLPQESAETRALLDAHARAEAAANVRIPLLVFSSPKVSAKAREFYTAAGAIVVPARDQTFRKLARLILDLSGGAGACCKDRASTQSGL